MPGNLSSKNFPSLDGKGVLPLQKERPFDGAHDVFGSGAQNHLRDFGVVGGAHEEEVVIILRVVALYAGRGVVFNRNEVRLYAIRFKITLGLFKDAIGWLF